MLIVDYARPKPRRPIPNFDAILLREEGPGILCWAVEGAVRLMRELDTTGTIQLLEAQRKRADDLLSESDSVRSFVRDCIETEHGAEVTIHDLTAAYRDYCDSRDWDPLRDRQFQSELPDAMLEYHRAPKRNDIRADGKSVRGFRGVRLQSTSQGPSDPSESTTNTPKPLFSDASDACIKPYAHARGSNDVDANHVKSLEHPSDPSEQENADDPPPDSFAARAPADDPDADYEIRERAAIMEYHGDMNPDHAREKYTAAPVGRAVTDTF